MVVMIEATIMVGTGVMQRAKHAGCTWARIVAQSSSAIMVHCLAQNVT
jgi:hypothetical protein